MRRHEINILALYEYMIGNVDYAVPTRHNLKLLGLPGFGTSGYTAVPYDFDYSGLVDAYYAIPTEGLGIKSVRERCYLGPCRENQDYIAAIEHINQFRDEILRLVWDFEYLDQKYKKGVVAYLEEYFEVAAHHNYLINSLEDSCH